jgi:mono/diheme cytochrome c family protein
VAGVLLSTCETQAGGFGHWGKNGCGPDGCVDRPPIDDTGGTWAWVRSTDQEKRAVMGLYNYYCIRCHGVDGRGVWDMPRIPDFTTIHWQERRSDAQIARVILEGRGCMPTFRQAMSAEQAWGLARYLRTFVPGTETPRPDRGSGGANRPKPEQKSP